MEKGYSNILGPTAAIIAGVLLLPLIVRYLDQPLIWQDVVMMIVGLIFPPALIVSIRKKVGYPLWTSIPTALGLTVMVICLSTLKLYLAAFSASLTTICWYILAFRR